MEIDIRTIDDVVPHIRDGSGIIISERPDHTIIDYVYLTDDTFDSAMALQCRGLKFDAEGRIIARPFHKFFNIGEREDPREIDWSRAHCVVDKLDGTMIHGAVLNGDLVFMTRMGLMKQARDALALASDGVLGLCHEQIKAGFTPIFEYTAPENRIVVEYHSAELTLLALREITSGRYRSDTDLRRLGKRYGVPVTRHWGRVEDIKSFMKDTRSLEDVEGYVIAFDDGHRLKIKADGYVLRHRALSNAHLEKNVLAWVMNNAVDDVIPLLAPDIAERVRSYQSEVHEAVTKRVDQVRDFFDAHENLERREFAEAVQRTLHVSLRSAAFAMLDGKDPRDVMNKHLIWASNSQSRLDKVRGLYDLTWSTKGMTEPDMG